MPDHTEAAELALHNWQHDAAFGAAAGVSHWYTTAGDIFLRAFGSILVTVVASLLSRLAWIYASRLTDRKQADRRESARVAELEREVAELRGEKQLSDMRDFLSGRPDPRP